MQLQRLDLVQKVIAVCCVLHNVCIDMGDTEAPDFAQLLPDCIAVENEEEQAAAAADRGRRLIRNEIVATFAERLLN